MSFFIARTKAYNRVDSRDSGTSTFKDTQQEKTRGRYGRDIIKRT